MSRLLRVLLPARVDGVQKLVGFAAALPELLQRHQLRLLEAELVRDALRTSMETSRDAAIPMRPLRLLRRLEEEHRAQHRFGIITFCRGLQSAENPLKRNAEPTLFKIKDLRKPSATCSVARRALRPGLFLEHVGDLLRNALASLQVPPP